MTKKVLALAAAAEAGAGVVVLVWPPIVVRLLFGAEINGAGVIMSRIVGIALIGLGVACWPGDSAFQALNGMLTYSALAMLYLSYIGVRWKAVGVLLWPAVVAHVILVALLVRARFKDRKTSSA
jgi:hypothetical protein